MHELTVEKENTDWRELNLTPAGTGSLTTHPDADGLIEKWFSPTPAEGGGGGDPSFSTWPHIDCICCFHELVYFLPLLPFSSCSSKSEPGRRRQAGWTKNFCDSLTVSSIPNCQRRIMWKTWTCFSWVREESVNYQREFVLILRHRGEFWVLDTASYHTEHGRLSTKYR